LFSLVLLGVTASFLPLSQGHAQVVVVKSSGPSADRFPVGTVLDEDDGIVLRKNDSVTVLHNGGTLVLNGPARLDQIERPAANSQRLTLAQITRAAQAKRVRAGATRDYGKEFQQALVENRRAQQSAKTLSARVPTMWHVDVSLPGAWCYVDDEELEMWRLDAEGGIDVMFTPEGSEQVKMRWPEGENYAYWPNRASPQDGTRYFVQSPDKFAHYVTLHHVEFVPDMVELAQTLSDNDCFYQLDLIAPEASDAS